MAWRLVRAVLPRLSTRQSMPRMLAHATTPARPDLQHRNANLEQYRQQFGSLNPHFERPNHFQTCEQLRAAHASAVPSGTCVEEIKIATAGRITSRRDASGKLVFLDIASNQSIIQVVMSKSRFANAVDYQCNAKTLRRGDIIEVEGYVGKTQTGELSVFASKVRLVAPCHADLPEVLTDQDTRSRDRPLELIVNNTLQQSIVIRAKIYRYLRQYLDSNGFTEVDTAVIAPHVGGAVAKPFITHSSAINANMYLRISPELHLKQLLIGGFDKVYELGKQYRNEGIDSTHNPEFTSCEFYEAYGDMSSLINRTEAIVRGMVECVHSSRVIPYTTQSGEVLSLDFASPFKRISVVSELQSRLDVTLPPLWDTEETLYSLRTVCEAKGIAKGKATVAGVLDAMISSVIEPICIQPTFLCDHPVVMSPLAKTHPHSAELTSRFELFINGQEFCNAYVELNDAVEQKQRMRQQAQHKAVDDDIPAPDLQYCSALEYGLPPCVGWGMGLDRMVMLLANKTHIRDVLAFPAVKPHPTNTKP